MYSSLDDVEFLSRSSSRVKVLDALHGSPRTREELKEATDVSRVTLSRILANFEDRGWIERTNGEYEATSKGEFVATELTGLLANIERSTTSAGRWSGCRPRSSTST